MNIINKDASSIDRGPSLIVLGVQKAATTTLFDILKDTKGFSAPSQKELHFFNNDNNYRRGVDWYFDLFEGEGIKFEATPDYFYSPNAAERIFEHLKNVKFVVIFRDPVKRCFSAWNMFRSFHSNPSTAKYIYQQYLRNSNPDVKGPLASLLFSEKFPSLEDCVRDDIFRLRASDSKEEPSFVRRGFYYEQVSRYLNIFDRRQFLFLEQDEFSRNTSASVKKVFELLGIEADVGSNLLQMNSNAGDYQGISLNEHVDLLSYLYDIYREPNNKLFNLIGEEYCWNSSWLDGNPLDRSSEKSKNQNAIQCRHAFFNNHVEPLNSWQTDRINALEEEFIKQVEHAQTLAENWSVQSDYVSHLERTTEALKEALHIKTEQAESITQDWTARGEHIEHLAQTIEILQGALEEQAEQTELITQDWTARGAHIEYLAQTIETLQGDLQKQAEKTESIKQGCAAREEHINQLECIVDVLQRELSKLKDSWCARLSRMAGKVRTK